MNTCPHCGQPVPLPREVLEEIPYTFAEPEEVKVEIQEKRKRYREVSVVQVVDFYAKESDDGI